MSLSSEARNLWYWHITNRLMCRTSRTCSLTSSIMTWSRLTCGFSFTMQQCYSDTDNPENKHFGLRCFTSSYVSIWCERRTSMHSYPASQTSNHKGIRTAKGICLIRQSTLSNYQEHNFYVIQVTRLRAATNLIHRLGYRDEAHQLIAVREPPLFRLRICIVSKLNVALLLVSPLVRIA